MVVPVRQATGRLLLVGVVAIGAACGESSPSQAPTSPTPAQPTQPTPPTPAPPSTPAIVSVAASLPAGQGSGFIPGQRARLIATATRDDGSSVDCTPTAAWSSSNPDVMTFAAEQPGEVRAVTRGQASVFAACEGTSSHALTLSVGGGVRITGLEAYPYFVTGGVQALLTATLVDDHGARIEDCGRDADWATSSRGFASLNALTENKILFHRGGARASADVTITARCNGQTSQLVVRMRPYRVSGTVRSSAGEPLAGVRITEKYSDIEMTTDANGNYVADFVEAKTEPVMSLPGYDSYSQELTWNAEPSVRLDVTLPAIPGIVLSASGKVCNLRPTDARYATECLAAGAPQTQSHSFTVPHDGALRLRTYWPDPPGGSGIDDNLVVTLTCNGTSVYNGEVYGVQGGGFTRPAKRDCAYVLTFRNPTQLRVLPYDFTVDLQ